jgi:hypothetical protein
LLQSILGSAEMPNLNDMAIFPLSEHLAINRKAPEEPVFVEAPIVPVDLGQTFGLHNRREPRILERQLPSLRLLGHRRPSVGAKGC